MACDYPIFLDLSGRLAVVVGAGSVAARKIDKLLSAGAHVRVVSREISEHVETMMSNRAATTTKDLFAAAAEDKPQLELVRENFKPAHLAGAFMVFACTDSHDVNSAVTKAASAAGALVNRVDAPTECDFFVPAVSSHGPVKLAISTGGASPALARFIRKQLDEHMPAHLGDLADELSHARAAVHRKIHRPEDQAAAWETLCGEESLRRLTDEGAPAWREWFETVIAKMAGH
jgi:siroheme synthase-like protein